MILESTKLCLEHLLASILGVEQVSLVAVAAAGFALMTDRCSSNLKAKRSSMKSNKIDANFKAYRVS